MVKVPSAGELGIGQNVSQARIPPVYRNLNIRPEALGATQGRQFMQLGQSISNVTEAIQKIDEHQSKAKAYDAFNKAEDDVRKALYDPENGIFARKAAESLTASKDSLTALDDIYQKNVENLNKRTRKRFDDMWVQKRNTILNTASRFEMQQRNVYKNESTNALINNAVDDAVKQYNNPQAVIDNKALIDYVIEDTIGFLPEGATDEMTVRRNELAKEKKAEAFDRMHTGIISKFASNGNTEMAKKYYQSVKKEITATNQIKIEALLKDGTLRERAQKEFDKINSSGKEEAVQLSMARNINDPELRDEVERRVKASWKEPKTIEAEKANAIKTEAWQQIIVNDVKPEELPLAMWTGIDKETRAKMYKYSTEGAPRESDVGTYLLLNERMLNEPETFRDKTNLLDFVTGLSTDDYKYFADHQKKLINNDKTDNVSVRTYQAIAVDRLEAIGIETTTKASDKDKQRTATFFREMSEELNKFYIENGRKPKEEEAEQIIDRLLIKGKAIKPTGKEKLLGGFIGELFGVGEKKGEAFVFEELEAFTVEDINAIPNSIQQQIKVSLENRGIIASEENIINTMNQMLRNRNGKIDNR